MVNRITGLSSGMDIDGIVAKLMNAERIPLNKMNQSKQILQWQQDDYRSMNSKIMDFRNTVFSMKLEAAYQAKKTTTDNDAAISVTGTASATTGVYALQIDKLAKAGSLTSSGDIVAGAGDSSKTMSNLGLGADTTLSIGGEKGTSTIQVKTTDTLSQVVANINGKSSITGVKVSYDTTLNRLFFVSATTGAQAKVDLKTPDADLLDNIFKLGDVANPVTTPATQAEITTSSRVFSGNTEAAASSLTASQTLVISYNGNNYEDVIDSSKTIGQVIDDINGSELGKTGVTAYLDASGKLAFFNPSGSGTPVTFSNKADNTADIVNTLGLDTATTSQTSYDTLTSTDNQNADITFNGVRSTNYTTNTITISGMVISLKNDNNGAGGVISHITVNQDVDTIYNSIKGFVDKYNSLIADLNSKVSEKRYRDYTPLTDEQKKDMKDDDIKLWTDKAKSGVLHSDMILTTAINNFRTSLSKTVSGLPSGDINQLSQIGITTGLYQEQGKLYIDEAKLRDAIATKPDQVQKLFTATDGISTSDDGDGLAIRLYDKAKDIMDRITKKAGVSTSVSSSYLIGKDMSRLDTRISDMNTRLSAIESRYYRQFTAMEQAINQMNAQSAQLASAFAN